MRGSRCLMCVALIGGASLANAAPTEHHVNAAFIGAGVPRALSWQTESEQSPVWCGTACNYLSMSSARIAPDTGSSYAPLGWPGAGVASFPDPSAIQRSIPTPQGTHDSSGREIVYGSTTYERAAMDVTRAGESLTAKVYQSGNQGVSGTGSAASTLAYHVRVQNQSSGARDYFIRFTAPPSLRSVGLAYYIGGPSGNQPMYIKQEYARSRSSVDVLVNGLPVWSTASNYFFPEDFSGSASSGFRTDWGYESDDDWYTVFVGRFASGDTFDLDFIVRADAVARAPQCGKETEPSTYPNPRVLMHCFSVSEGRGLLPLSSQQEFFEIYSKVVSTPVLQLPPGPLAVLKDQ